jgi:hypothetical protein
MGHLDSRKATDGKSHLRSSPSSTARQSRRNFVSTSIVRSGHAWLFRGEESTVTSRGQQDGAGGGHCCTVREGDADGERTYRIGQEHRGSSLCSSGWDRSGLSGLRARSETSPPRSSGPLSQMPQARKLYNMPVNPKAMAVNQEAQSSKPVCGAK